MTHKEIAKALANAIISYDDRLPQGLREQIVIDIETILKAVAEEEREECAKIVDDYDDGIWWLSKVSERIRARGEP